MKTYIKKALPLLLTLLLLSGCNQKNDSSSTVEPDRTPAPTAEPAPAPVSLPDGSEVPANTEELRIEGDVGSETEAWEQALSRLPELRLLELPGSSLSADQLRSLRESCAAEIRYTPLVNGEPLELSAESLDLSGCDAEELSAYLPWLPLMEKLGDIELGEENEERKLSWEDILELEEAAPQARPHYAFTLFDKSFTLLDTTLDLNHRKMKDGGELVRRVVRCMPELELLDMDTCGVKSEDMAAIRDEFPAVKVVWRIFFGKRYTCRTDVEKILASWPGAGLITDYDCQELKYCTEVKYLDIGHNWSLTDITFVSSMPKLEVCVMSYLKCLSDLTPFASCTHLEYLELAKCNVSDVTPLKDLKELKHLSLLLNPVEDITCLYGMDSLERLYLGILTPVPKEQTDEMQRLHPELEINLDTMDPRGGRWRGWYEGATLHKVDRYILLKEQFGYVYPDDYALPEADPLYKYHG